MAFVLTLAFVNGCATVISKMINYRCTKILGTYNGSLVNYVVATVLSLLYYFYVLPDLILTFTLFPKLPGGCILEAHSALLRFLFLWLRFLV